MEFLQTLAQVIDVQHHVRKAFHSKNTGYRRIVQKVQHTVAARERVEVRVPTTLSSVLRLRSWSGYGMLRSIWIAGYFSVHPRLYLCLAGPLLSSLQGQQRKAITHRSHPISGPLLAALHPSMCVALCKPCPYPLQCTRFLLLSTVYFV